MPSENTKNDSAVAVFNDHESAEAAIKKLAAAGIDMKHLSVVGKEDVLSGSSSR